MPIKRVILKPGEEARIREGHPWVYDNEIARIVSGNGEAAAQLSSGELADVESDRREYLGRAMVNPRSKITARIYSPSKEGVDKGFFKRRIRQSLERRKIFYDFFRDSSRIVFGEADFLPALIIDRFVGWPREAVSPLGLAPTFQAAAAALGPPGAWLAIQFLSAGMDCRRAEILVALEEIFESFTGIQGIVEKSSPRIREQEGLPPGEGCLAGTVPPEGIVIFEGDLPFIVHLDKGQKTGWFLDQRENRRLAARFAPGGRVLDLCCYTGGFAVHAARAGAAEVTAVDASAEALETARQNAALNGVTVAFREGDIFRLLPEYEREAKAQGRFNLVILDPPAFAKTRPALEGALRGYKEVNLRAIRLLDRGGVLVSCSCSQALGEARFRWVIAQAAADAGRRLVELDFRGQAADHPVLVGYGESRYLKCGVYRAL